MRPLLLTLGAAAAVSVAAATTVVSRRAGPLGTAQQREVRPGPDSARVDAFLRALASTDPMLCEMVTDQLGNFWWTDGELGAGRFADARVEARAAKDSITDPVRDAAAVRLLAARLAADDPCVRLLAAKMLGRSAADDGVLQRLLADASPRVREAALRAAGVRERPALQAHITSMLAAREAPVAAMAAWTLGEWELRSSVPPLRTALRNDAPAVRAAAARALGQIEDPAATPDLERLVAEDADRLVRLAAIGALGNLEQLRSAPVLAGVIEQGDIGLAVAAAEAIGNLDGLRTAPRSLVRATESFDQRLRYAALEALTQFEDEGLAPVLLRFITDPDADVRTRVIEALGNLRVRSAVPAITRALRDPNPEVRRAAIEALAEIDER